MIEYKGLVIKKPPIFSKSSVGTRFPEFETKNNSYYKDGKESVILGKKLPLYNHEEETVMIEDITTSSKDLSVHLGQF